MALFQERLRPDHDLEVFDSGNEQLDQWLRTSALISDRAGTGRTYVWLDDEGQLIAYFTLAPHLVRRDEVPKRLAHGSPDSIPSVLIARLALTKALQGKGHGAVLLVEAIRTALDAMRTAGGRLIVVDAIDVLAASFYEHHGFRRIPENPYRLFQKATDAAKSLGISWP